ncbi:MAG: hypothetical protein HRT66_02780 [Flavobacteriaceae bacterium]|nr:hypothetical protein [Flavobacteriaceae bacterium]
MATNKDITVENKLRALYDLQLIDTRIDRLTSVRGELPLEIEDLEDELSGLSKRLEKLELSVKNSKEEVVAKKTAIKDHQDSMTKYISQQKNVRNNREYDSLSKEIEYQELEIEFAEKKIKEGTFQMERKAAKVTELKSTLDEKESHLNHKKEALEGIIKETKEEEDFLKNKSDEFSKVLDDHLLKAYRRIRGKVKNGLAVVSIDRGASEGSYFVIPSQTQIEIANRKKITIDEYSGRILVDSALAEEEMIKMNKLFS